MRRYSVMYFISQSFKGLFRNGIMSLASITVLMSCLIVMGCFGLLVVNINSNLDSLGDMNEIVAFVKMNKTEEEISAIGEKIRAFDNVKSVEYISKEQALEEEKAKYEKDYPHFFDGVTSDIYPASFVITYNDNSEVETLKYQLNKLVGEADDDTADLDKISVRSDVASAIETLKKGVIYVFAWFLALLFFVSIFVIINTIKIAVFSRRQEITVMRYVGATNWFIMLPFILEGVIIGLISSGIAFFVQFGIYEFVQQMFASDYGMISILSFESLRSYVLIAFVGIGIITGIIGSSISLRKNLKA